jgi:hypothetical protein
MATPNRSNTADQVKDIVHKRFDAVVFMHIGDKQVKIGSSKPISASIYAAGIRRGTSEDTMALLVCTPSTLKADIITKLPWIQLHLRRYSEISDLYNQFRLSWEDVKMDQDLNVNGYDNAPSISLQEISKLSTDNRATYKTIDDKVRLTLETSNPDPDGLGGHDLPEKTDFIPALEQFSTVLWFV